jgi:hypothetical protein
MTGKWPWERIVQLVQLPMSQLYCIETFWEGLPDKSPDQQFCGAKIIFLWVPIYPYKIQKFRGEELSDRFSRTKKMK